MSGGHWDKLGNEYERSYVCLLWLRLLAEQVELVTWEPEGEDELGVDAWFEAAGRRVAVQCKLRTTGSWSPTALSDSRVPRAAFHQLERSGGADEYWLVTTADAPSLRGLIEWAKSGAESPRLEEQPRRLVASIGLDIENPENVSRLRAAAGRMEVHVLNGPVLNQQIRDMAQLLVGDDGKQLISELGSLPVSNTLRRHLSNNELRGLLSRDIAWHRSVDSAPLLERTRARGREYVEDVRGRRLLSVPIDRPEVQALMDLVRSQRGPSTIVVHGHAGTGKSDVLAEAIDRWIESRDLVIPVLPDELDLLNEEDLTADRVAALANGAPIALVIDQLDQVLQAGREARRLIRDLGRVVRSWRARGCTLIVGCRTVDATHETQLRQILHGDVDSQVRTLEIGDLPEELVTPALTRAGISWSTLGIHARKFVRRPLCLGMIEALTARGGWQGARTIHELVRCWWDAMVASDDAKERALDAVFDLLEARGARAVDRHELVRHDSAIHALLRDGILHLDARDRVGPFHQSLVDSRLARRLGSSADPEDALARLGARDAQGFHQARRLRYAVPILANREGGGAEILDTIFRSEHVRPLVKRALCLGLRDECEPPAAVTQVVSGWLADEEWFEFVAHGLLAGQGTWLRACRPGVESAWARADENQQDVLLDLLASVSVQEGDLVAELLTAWATPETSFWDRTYRIFVQNPSEDSEALFDARMGAVGPTWRPSFHVNWNELLRAHPVRATRILERSVKELTREELTAARVVPCFPRSEDISDEALLAAPEIWDATRTWWTRLEVEDLEEVSSTLGEAGRAPVVELVEILARCAARLLDEGQRDWGELTADLPDPLRELDAWLLLETGARLRGLTPAAVRAAAHWITREQRFVRLRIGSGRNHDELKLLCAFIERIGAHLSDRDLAALERWALDHREPWSAGDERERWRESAAGRELRPNSRGIVALRVLRSLPRDRLGLEARARLAECERKFGSPGAADDRTHVPVRGMFIASPVPDAVARHWTPGEWIRRLNEAPEHAPISSRDEDDTIRCYDREQLIAQLGRLARLFSRSFLAVAEAASMADEPLEGRIFATLLEAIGQGARFSRTQYDEFDEPAPDDAVERLATRPAFLHNRACALALGRTVEARANHDWPSEVVERLKEIASGDSLSADEITPPFRREIDHLTFARLNDTACAAIRALGALAKTHPSLRGPLLDMTGDLTGRDPLPRRASAAVLAFACREADIERATSQILRASVVELVAAERDCLAAMLSLAHDDAAPRPLRTALRDRILRLTESLDPAISTRGGVAAAALCHVGVIDLEELRTRISKNSKARQGAAEQIAHIVLRGEDSAWARDYAIELANDAVDSVGDAVLRHLASRHSDPNSEDDALLKELVVSRGAKRWRLQLLERLDARADLVPAAPWVIRMAELALADRPDEEGLADALLRFAEPRRLGDLLARLVEECERLGENEVRVLALDAWDDLLLRDPREVGELLEKSTE